MAAAEAVAAAVAAGPWAAEAPSSLLLVVGGECSCPGLLNYVLEELERGGAGVGWQGWGGPGGGWGGVPRAGGGTAGAGGG